MEPVLHLIAVDGRGHVRLVAAKVGHQSLKTYARRGDAVIIATRDGILLIFIHFILCLLNTLISVIMRLVINIYLWYGDSILNMMQYRDF